MCSLLRKRRHGTLMQLLLVLLKVDRSLVVGLRRRRAWRGGRRHKAWQLPQRHCIRHIKKATAPFKLVSRMSIANATGNLGLLTVDLECA